MDLRDFCFDLLPACFTERTKAFEEMHAGAITAISGGSQYCNGHLPRGSGKTTFVAAAALWSVLERLREFPIVWSTAETAALDLKKTSAIMAKQPLVVDCYPDAQEVVRLIEFRGINSTAMGLVRTLDTGKCIRPDIHFIDSPYSYEARRWHTLHNRVQRRVHDMMSEGPCVLLESQNAD